MNVWLSGSSLRLAGGHQSAAKVKGQAGKGLTVHLAVQDTVEAALRLHKDCHGGHLGRVCEEEKSMVIVGNDHKFHPSCTLAAFLLHLP